MYQSTNTRFQISFVSTSPIGSPVRNEVIIKHTHSEISSAAISTSEIDIYKREAARFSAQLEEIRAQMLQMQDVKASMLSRHRLHIAETILTLKCPRQQCGVAIFDFNGCFAVTCNACNCGFCGWCLMDCGNDAHSHVKICQHSPPAYRGSYYGTMQEFNQVHRTKRRERVLAYIRSEVDIGDQESVKELIRQDLSDLGIQL